MDNLLQSILEIEGVNGAFVANGAGRILGYRAHSVYDVELFRRVSKHVLSAVDSVRLIQKDCNAINAQFAEGKLLIRNLSDSDSASDRTAVLVVIADGRLNTSFAGVAIRVAVAKLKALFVSNPDGAFASGDQSHQQAATSAISPGQVHATASVPTGSLSGLGSMGAPGRANVSEVATSGLSWSGLSGSSTMSGSGVFVADAASSEFLTTCTKALAKSVGPMAKFRVKDAARKVSGERPFSLDNAEELLAELSRSLSTPAAVAQFRAQVRKGH